MDYFNYGRLNSLENAFANNPYVQQNLNQFTPNGTIQPKTETVSYAIVKGLQEARDYPVVPNGTCVLFDGEKSEFYKKTVDGMGVADLRLFEYKEKPLTNNSPAISEKVDKSEFDALKRQIEELKNMIKRNPVRRGDNNAVNIQ